MSNFFESTDLLGRSKRKSRSYSLDWDVKDVINYFSRRTDSEPTADDDDK